MGHARPDRYARSGGPSRLTPRFSALHCGRAPKRIRLAFDLQRLAAVDAFGGAVLSSRNLRQNQTGNGNAGEEAKLIHRRDPFRSAPRPQGYTACF
jgi:hypothetical protein